MTLNKTKIEWCDLTWNPVTGCYHGCPYCYARKIAERFKGSKAWQNGFTPTMHPERLNDPVNEEVPQTIFVCSMADLFGDWVPEDWILDVLSTCIFAPQHTFLFLTKNPKRYLTIPSDFVRDHMWFGVSVTGNEDALRIHELRKLHTENRFVSFEPLLSIPHGVNLKGIPQVIIGAQTNPSVEITPDMIRPIGGELGHNAMFCKNSTPSWCVRRELMWTIHKPTERVAV